MVCNVIEIPRQAEILSLVSPAFVTTYPEIEHKGTIPADILKAMESSWRRRVFEEQRITFSCLQDVFVVQEGLVFNRSGQLYQNSITQHTSEEIESGHTAVVEELKNTKLNSLKGTSVLCKKRGATNFGHWLVEMLPKAFLSKMFLNFDHQNYIIPEVGGQLSHVISESLQMLNFHAGSHSAVANDVVHVENLILVDGLTHHGVFMSPLVTICTEALSACVPGAGYEKILVTRKTAMSRRLIGEEEIEKRAVDLGFSLIDPGSLTLAEQIAAFKSAKEIVGVMGAEMTNIIFAPRNARISNIAPAGMPDTFFWFIAGMRGLEYRELRCLGSGPPRGMAPWDTDLMFASSDFDYAFR